MQQKGSLIRRAAALAAVFGLAFLVRSLYAVDQAPVMYSPEQTGTRMAQRYDDTAVAILAGEGILWPRVRDEQRTGLLQSVPLGRFGSANEVAALVTYLASPQASYITGQTLHINGGMYLA